MIFLEGGIHLLLTYLKNKLIEHWVKGIGIQESIHEGVIIVNKEVANEGFAVNDGLMKEVFITYDICSYTFFVSLSLFSLSRMRMRMRMHASRQSGACPLQSMHAPFVFCV